MRRAALAAACVALVLLAGATSLGVRSFHPYAAESANAAAAGTCVAWKKHHKRVVRYVKKDGKRKKVVRVKRWRTCAKRAAPAPVTPPVVAPPPSEPQPEPEDPTIPRLGVKAVEWSYTLSRPEVPAGEVVVELNNMGEDPHNLNLQLEDGSGPEEEIVTVGPGVQGKAKFDLTAGKYRLWCDLDGHEAAGMKATLLVTE